MQTSLSISTTNEITGRIVKKQLGIVLGSSVQARWFGADIVAQIRNLVGGELTEYTNLLDATRDKALFKMSNEALSLGANAVVNVRFATSQIGRNAAEILVYGTAVIVE
jgi:uncharacterized protein YbjQ (UPF0145 family)